MDQPIDSIDSIDSNNSNNSDDWTNIIKDKSRENLKPIKNSINLTNDMEYVEMIHIDEFTNNDDIDLLKKSSIVARNLKFYIHKKYN
jgi:hypothetical protein